MPITVGFCVVYKALAKLWQRLYVDWMFAEGFIAAIGDGVWREHRVLLLLPRVVLC